MRVTAAIPAYNEEGYLPAVLDPLTREAGGMLDDIVVVDDGSTDRTAEVAREYGATVLGHQDDNGNPLNRGKASAFRTAVLHCAGTAQDAIFMMDADMIGLSGAAVGRFLRHVERGEDYVVAQYRQLPGNIMADGNMCPANYSGFRAIRMERLRPVYDDTQQDHKVLEPFFANPSRGFCLEPMLHYLLRDLVPIVVDLGLSSRPVGRNDHRYNRRISDGLLWGEVIADVLERTEPEDRPSVARLLTESARDEVRTALTPVRERYPYIFT